MQAIYNLSAVFTQYSATAEQEVRENVRGPTLFLAALLFFSLALPSTSSEPVSDLTSLEDSYQDLNLAEVAQHLERRLPVAHKQDSYKLAKLLVQLSDRHMLSPGLILSVIETESSYRYGTVSKKGAVGLMQLLPETAKEVAAKYRIHEYKSAQDLYDPRINLRLGAAYLAYLRGRFGASAHYLAAYNMGPTALKTRLRNGNYDLGAVEKYVKNIHKRTHTLRLKSAAKPGSPLSGRRAVRLLAEAI